RNPQDFLAAIFGVKPSPAPGTKPRRSCWLVGSTIRSGAMRKVLWFVPAIVLPVFGIAFVTSASAGPMPVVQVQSPHLMIERARWIHQVDRSGRRSLVWLRRHSRKRAVSANPNVDRPDRPANQAGWGQMPGR